VRIIDFLADPAMRAIYLPGTLAGLCTVVMCGLVSPLVVVKRLGFIGQGISHSAFGGVGVAAMLAAMGVIAIGGAAEFGVIAAFCIAAALGMGLLADRKRTPEDTTIGLFLVGSMAAGALLVAMARDRAITAGRAPDARSWESILFGSVVNAGDAEVVLAAIVLVIAIAAVLMLRRPLLFWAFDEDAARAFGVPTRLIRGALMVLLALIVVTAMKIAGVVLASALLVLPGATAMKLSTRLIPVTLLSIACGILGLLVGLALSVQQNWQPGPCVVLVMAAMFGSALGWSRFAPARPAA
jgi:zinc transport system permease protein